MKRCLCYFNCSWLSCFGNEDERILCGGLFPMHFGSIRDMSTNSDYRPFVHALTSFDYALSGEATFHGDHDVTKLDRQCIRALIKHRNNDGNGNGKGTANIFPQYINETFLAFCRERTLV